MILFISFIIFISILIEISMLSLFYETANLIKYTPNLSVGEE